MNVLANLLQQAAVALLAISARRSGVMLLARFQPKRRAFSVARIVRLRGILPNTSGDKFLHFRSPTAGKTCVSQFLAPKFIHALRRCAIIPARTRKTAVDATSRKDRQALRGIVSLLLAFAALAERVGTKPRPIRIAMLWLLRAVEAIAWDFVMAEALDSGVYPELDVSIRAHDIADDAGRLARSFKAMADLLADLIRRHPQASPTERISGLILDCTHWAPAHSFGRMTRTAPDTS